LGILAFPAVAQVWSQFTDGTFTVETASVADESRLKEVFEILQEAKQDLKENQNYELPKEVNVRIYPNLEAFTKATQAPWYVAAIADRTTNSIHSQRLQVLLDRNSLKQTLRHELAHLAQPDDWPRWLNEGSAMIFSAEKLTAEPFETISEARLNELLATTPTKEQLARAAATAYNWSVNYWQNQAE